MKRQTFVTVGRSRYLQTTNLNHIVLHLTLEELKVVEAEDCEVEQRPVEAAVEFHPFFWEPSKHCAITLSFSMEFHTQTLHVTHICRSVGVVLEVNGAAYMAVP